jgi:hypothetical protein
LSYYKCEFEEVRSGRSRRLKQNHFQKTARVRSGAVRTLIFSIRRSADGTQETVNPAFFVYREWLLYVKIWDWYRVCSFLRLNAFYLFFIGLANSSVASKAQT